MGRLWTFALIALLAVACATPAMAIEPANAVGMVFSRTIDGASVGNGFFVGDGTWLITSRSVIFPPRPSGLHQGEAMVTVLSSYLGDAGEAQIVAQDRDWDLVLLRVQWEGHPSLLLAQEVDVLAAAQVQIVGYPTIPAAPQAGRQSLGVSGVVVRRSMTRSLLTASAPTGSGWAGAPMILANGAVAGCYVRTQADGTAGNGVAAGAIRRLIEQTGVNRALTPPRTSLAPSPQAAEATAIYLRGLAASTAGDASAAYQHFQTFLKLRPNSAIGFRDAAGQLRALNRLDEAQASYAKALELEPQLASARVLYGQLLHDRIMPKAAEDHLRYAWRNGRGSRAAVIPLCNLLRQQRREAESLQILEQAVQSSPFDGHLWNCIGQDRRATDDHAGAAAAFARAADLLPEDEVSRIQAAEEYEAAGFIARAEEQFQILLQQNRQSPAGHYLFARLLARDRARRDEALKHAELALNLSDRSGAPPRDVVRSLINAIRTGRVTPADELRL